MPQLSLSSLLTSLFYLLPLYLFVLAPILRQLFPPSPDSLRPSSAPFFQDDADLAIPPEDLDYPVLDPEILSLDDGVQVDCPPDAYRTHLLSRDPLIIYIEDFLSDAEADHLAELGHQNYTPSIVYDGTTQKIDPSRRLSDRALLSRDDRTVRCLEARAHAFQGWRPHLYIERMWAQRYNASGHYRHHYDWAGSAARGGDRLSTFMVYLGDDCVGGGTNFPRLKPPRDRAWCRFLECDDAEHSGHPHAPQGITFRPIKGNAIFWENLRPDGSGYPETWHAALPVTSGTKVGLNVWSWYQPPRRRE
ncbi:oxidoreductase [Aspergillus ambiguus]|uniref:oxidoreductase, 2OG-Fe(II) oxygenase family n=1 Tax=Aspergillus ambiguus TaxID=176160 RepID=UPI003CCE388E